MFFVAKERSLMETNQIPFYARILFIIGIGVALAVALDNIVIGVGVATVFFAGFVMRRNRITETSGENHE